MTEERHELGHCDCGQAFTLIRNSKRPTMWKDGRRYVYTNRPDDGACIFRCDFCGETIHDTFTRAAAALPGDDGDDGGVR